MDMLDNLLSKIGLERVAKRQALINCLEKQHNELLVKLKNSLATYKRNKKLKTEDPVETINDLWNDYSDLNIKLCRSLKKYRKKEKSLRNNVVRKVQLLHKEYQILIKIYEESKCTFLEDLDTPGFNIEDFEIPDNSYRIVEQEKHVFWKEYNSLMQNVVDALGKISAEPEETLVKLKDRNTYICSGRKITSFQNKVVEAEQKVLQLVITKIIY